MCVQIYSYNYPSIWEELNLEQLYLDIVLVKHTKVIMESGFSKENKEKRKNISIQKKPFRNDLNPY